DIVIPVEMLKIDAGKHPHSWLLFNKINQEIGISNEVKIKVKDLLCSSPTLPQYAIEFGYNETAQKRKIYEDEVRYVNSMLMAEADEGVVFRNKGRVELPKEPDVE
ncbi:MAG: hypothetical protein K2K10_13645, partial [Acetatifactor sp.]|nr:hypothetical protein [Acetatifactor sp.]